MLFDNVLAMRREKRSHSLRRNMLRQHCASFDEVREELFDKFGICGQCEVSCDRGVIPVLELRPNDRMIARGQGLASLQFILKNDDANNRDPATFVEEGFFGNGLPTSRFAVGRDSKITRYMHAGIGSRPFEIEMKLKERQRDQLLHDCTVEELCIPVFEERTELLMEGVYIACPSVADVAAIALPDGRPTQMVAMAH